MHASSFDNMEKCFDRFIFGDFLEARKQITVLEVGSADVNGSYRPICDDPRIRFQGADLEAGPGVDVVLDDPYRLPFEDGSFDVAISGQMFEHCERFWLVFQEMIRVLKHDGRAILIAPSAGPIHRYPVDCYRFYPDAFQALARLAGCHVWSLYQDELGPWKDLVGVFAKQPADPDRRSLPRLRLAPQVPRGTPEAEAIGGAADRLAVLERIHRDLGPELYFEIGVENGLSLAPARCEAVGVDPVPDITVTLSREPRLFRETSDDFFELRRDAITRPVDLALIDGMHHFDNSLRDFMNIERVSHPAGLVMIDDIFPNHPMQARRNRATQIWTGDVWKLAAILKTHRPDLLLFPLDVSPAGLLLVAGLKPDNRILRDGYSTIVDGMMPEPPPEVLAAVIRRDGSIDPGGLRPWILIARLRELRRSNASVKAVQDALSVMRGAP